MEDFVETVLDFVSNSKRAVMLAVALIIIAIALSSFYHVDQKQVGLVTRFGKIESVEQAGLHFKFPVADKVTLYDTSIQQITIRKDAANSSDNQVVYGDLNIQYYVTASSVKLLYSRYPNYEMRVSSLAQDIFRQIIGKYDTSDIPGKRAEIEQKVFARLSEESTRLYGIQITEVQCVGFDYSETFKQSIDAMTQAKARERRSEIERDQAAVQAQQTKIEAEARATARRAQADGESYSTMVNAKAEAERIRLHGEAQASSIKAQTDALKASPEFVKYTTAQRWDGKLPVNIGVGASASSIPMVNVGSLDH